MKIGIMQPYFFPYIGYWQLINAVDKYVICDDVNYIKNGWINRNKILINKEPRLISLQIRKVSQNKLINEVELFGDINYNNNLLKNIEIYYKKAPYFNDVFPLIERAIYQNERNIARYLEYVIRLVCNYLNIDTELIISSELDKNNDLRFQDRVIDICKILQADQYINAIGGLNLYSKEEFALENIQLYFLKTGEVSYQQFNNEFIPNLSIIDVMMFNSIEEITIMLTRYELV